MFILCGITLAEPLGSAEPMLKNTGLIWWLIMLSLGLCNQIDKVPNPMQNTFSQLFQLLLSIG